MQNHCAAPKCTNVTFDTQPLFRFPRDEERCRKWVESCQRQDLMEKSSEQLYRYYRLCGKHFKMSSTDDALKDDAVPNIFDAPIQPQNGQVKRSKEMTKDDEILIKGRKKIKMSQVETNKDDVQANPEEKMYKQYLQSLFEVLALLGGQNIPLTGPVYNKPDAFMLSNIQSLLDYCRNCGDEVLKRSFDGNMELCSSAQLNQLIEVLEKSIRSKLTEEVKKNGLFSLITDDLVKISGEWCLPVFLRYIDQSNCQRERFLGFLSFEGDEDALAENLLSEMTDKWGLNMEQCRGQAHSGSGIHFRKIKTFADKLMNRHPLAVLTVRSTCTLNMSLASGMALSGVQLVLCTLMKIESFFSQFPSLYVELDHAISIFYPDKEERANELKEICRTNWTRRHDSFEVALEILEALLLCVDSVHDNEDLRWSDEITHSALEISKALADFELIMALIVLKNTMILIRAFGKKMQGKATDTHCAANSLKGVLHSLKEVSDNIDVYHEFWYDEAVNLAAALEIPVKVPRSFLRKHQLELGIIQPGSYYKENLSVPVVKHVIKEMKELFCVEHLKALKCLSVVPSVIEQHKATEPDEENIQVFKNEIPNAGTLTAELHCWWVKWSKKGKVENLPSSLQETLQLPDVKFFPNMLAVLRLIGILPSLALEDSCDVAHKRFKMYMDNTPDASKSKSLALLNINSDVGYDLDSMVQVYMKIYPHRDSAC